MIQGRNIKMYFCLLLNDVQIILKTRSKAFKPKSVVEKKRQIDIVPIWSFRNTYTYILDEYQQSSCGKGVDYRQNNRGTHTKTRERQFVNSQKFKGKIEYVQKYPNLTAVQIETALLLGLQ